jgi:hypothetical protein
VTIEWQEKNSVIQKYELSKTFVLALELI